MKLESSNKFLESNFAWAVGKTATFVVTGTKNGAVNKGEGNQWYGPDGEIIKTPDKPWAEPKDYKPCFWAGYFDRTAYYIRDFVHQVAGAYYVGLEEEIFNMYYTFVSNASEKTGWFAPWAFNFDNSIYYMDTPNYNRFVREITAQFELVEKAYQLYLLTGDKRYAEDDVIFNFIEKTMTVFIDRLDGTVFDEKNGIPEGKGDIFEISATYNERGFNAAEAGDSIAAMYQAIIAYANILKIRGNTEETESQFKRAEELKKYFNNDWSIVKDSDMYAYAIDNKGKKHYKWYKQGSEIFGGETLKFIPLKDITYPGERNEKLLDYIYQCELDPRTREDNIESLTYLPDLFFRHNRSEEAWFWMKHIVSQKDLPHEHKSQGANGDYPEISFTFISQVIEGLMGITVDAAAGEIAVNPCLPDEVCDVRIYDLKFGEYSVDVFIEKEKVIIKNNGSRPIKRLDNFLKKYCPRKIDRE
ncbi:MAG: hypothetical protein IJZ35_01630 [Clostridia bacterium]|nr:hypothetical protein [Clostridia bacterium]